MRRGALEAGGSEDCRRGAGSQQARPWSSAAAMSAQCCAGQVSGAGCRAGVDGSRGGAGRLGAARGLPWVCTRAPRWKRVRRVGRPGPIPRRLGYCLGPERGAGQSGEIQCRAGGRAGRGRGEARESPPRSPRPALRTSLGRGGQDLVEDPYCSWRVSSPPRTQMSSAAHPGKDGGLGATSPFPRSAQNSGPMAQAGCVCHFARLEHGLRTFGNVSKPGFRTTVLRSRRGEGEAEALPPAFPDPTLAGRHRGCLGRARASPIPGRN